MSANHTRWPRHNLALFPKCALKSPNGILDLLVLTLRRASPASSTNSEDIALDFVAYICIKYRWRFTNSNPNMHNLSSDAAMSNPNGSLSQKLCYSPGPHIE